MSAIAGPHSGRQMVRAATPPANRYEVQRDGCWIWTGATNTGYGSVRYAGRTASAHRAFYAHYVGDIPAGKVVMHTCDQPLCVRPDHLRVGTQGENQATMAAKGRAARIRGEASTSARLSDRDAATVKTMVRDGMSQREVAAIFGVSQPTISYIATGRRWSPPDSEVNR